METLKSIVAVFTLFSLGLIFGQTDLGRSVYYRSISWVKNTTVSQEVNKAVDNTKKSSIKLKDKIEAKYEEVKVQAKEKTSSVIDDVKGFTTIKTKKQGTSFFNRSIKNGYVCEHFSSSKIKYSRCNKMASNELIKNPN